MGKLMHHIRSFRFKGILTILLVFLMMAVLLFVELSGVRVNRRQNHIKLLPTDRIVTKEEALASVPIKTLLIRDSSNETSLLAYEQVFGILKDMKVGYHEVDLANEEIPSFQSYSEVIVLLTDLSSMGTSVIALTDWVSEGGAAWFPLTLESTPHFSAIQQMLGIDEIASTYYTVESIYVASEYMIGGGRSFHLSTPFESSQAVILAQDGTEVFAAASVPDGIPLVWRTHYGEGVFVVDNIGIYEKALRGFYAASYSLLSDVCVYPVINASVFYLDDFPSQIPSGNNQYIMRDYQTSIRDFYINIWWPSMLNIADRYGLKYTGLTIETYDDMTDGTTDTVPDTNLFLNFGNMLLRKGGELGYHGYNHQPLCLDNVNYQGLFDYNTWESVQAMENAFDHLADFCNEFFPDTEFSLYVPPSNLLSAEGRDFLISQYPEIKTISGIYFEDIMFEDLDCTCVQEFDVDQNGVVDQPRIISGFILDEFQYLAAISELNLHFINSHFTHPDDALDEERGAMLGWETLKSRFNEFLSWLYSSAPGLRNLTGTETSAAVQRYVAAAPRTEFSEDAAKITIENFYDEVYLMVRFNAKVPDKISGGTLTHLTGDLYLLCATDSVVDITLK